MITWMQRNKKYLVVTIWISTIAFVGAGFVGWGAYDMNSNRANSVAKVGDRKVTIQELNEKYSQLFNYYNNIFEGKLTKEKASEMGLENLALQASIQDSLLLNFAQDLGFKASDEDVIKYITQDPNFQTDGIFNKNLYYDSLRRARINPNDYEQSLKRTVLLQKLNDAINLNANLKDIEIMSAAFSMQDTIAFKIITVGKNEVKIDENELKELWNKNKNLYMTKTFYELETIFVPLKGIELNNEAIKAYYEENKANYRDNEDKILSFENVKEQVGKDYALEQSKSIALEKYVALKKGEIKTESVMSFDEDNANLPLDEFKNAHVGDIVKPIAYNDGYIVSRVKNIILPKPMEFLDARDMVLKAYLQDKTGEILNQKSKDALKNFDVNAALRTTISKDKEVSIDGLDIFEAGNFLSQVFDSSNKKGYITLGNKSVIYEILEQKLLTGDDESYKVLALQNMQAMKNSELMQDLVKELQKRYKVEEYIKR